MNCCKPLQKVDLPAPGGPIGMMIVVIPDGWGSELELLAWHLRVESLFHVKGEVGGSAINEGLAHGR